MDDYIPPPPAYSEQEFDRKVSQAESLSILPNPDFDEDGWERYDPSAFEGSPAVPSGSISSNTLNSPTSQSSSSKGNGMPFSHQSTSQSDKSISNLPSIVPLRIEKKSHSQHGSSYTDQNFLESKSSTPSRQSFSKSNSGSSTSGYHGESSTHMYQNTSTAYAIPSPLFDKTSSYARPSSTAERPGHEEDAFDPYREYQTSQPYQPTRQSLPVIPRPLSANQRPATHARSHSEAFHSPSTPHVQFDPSIAYGKPNLTVPLTAIQAIHSSLPSPAKPDVQYDAHSFYNSSVSSKILPIRPPRGDAYYQAPAYDQANQQGTIIHQNYPLRTGQQPQIFNDDYTTRNTSRQLVVDNSRQPSAWQSPSRSLSHYHNSPRPVSSADSSRFSQYSTGSSRDSVYSTQSDWYTPR